MLDAGRREIGDGDGEEDGESQAGTPELDGSRNTDRQPDKAVRAGVGQPLEHRVEPVDAVLDDPAFRAAVEVDQGSVDTV